jgi:hypothetical protein
MTAFLNDTSRLVDYHGPAVFLADLPGVLLPGATLLFRPPTDAARDAIQIAWQEQLPLIATTPGIVRRIVPIDGVELGCLIQPVAVQTLPSGDTLAALKGVARGLILFAAAESGQMQIVPAEGLPDCYPSVPELDRADARRRLLACVMSRLPNLAHRDLFPVLETELPLGRLCDLLVEALLPAIADRDRALQELNVDARCRWLLQRLEQLPPAGDASFPPGFSAN